jgi:hypothetical protein
MPTEAFLKGYSEYNKYFDQPIDVNQVNPYNKETEKNLWIEWRDGWFDALMDSSLHLGK